MSKNKGNSKLVKTKHISSGMRRARRARQELRQVESKVRRWNGYKNDEARVASKAGQRRKGWDTSGLEKRARQLQSIIDKGCSTVR